MRVDRWGAMWCYVEGGKTEDPASALRASGLAGEVRRKPGKVRIWFASPEGIRPARAQWTWKRQKDLGKDGQNRSEVGRRWAPHLTVLRPGKGDSSVLRWGRWISPIWRGSQCPATERILGGMWVCLGPLRSSLSSFLLLLWAWGATIGLFWDCLWIIWSMHPKSPKLEATQISINRRIR